MSVVVSGKSSIKDYFAEMRAKREQTWTVLFNSMSGVNLDLTLLSKPILKSKLKTLDNHKIEVMIFDDKEMISTVVSANKRTASPDYLLQIWNGSKSAIIPVMINPNANRDWAERVIPLTSAELALTSWLLNALESANGAYLVVDEIVKSVADKEGMHSVFTVLN